MRSLVVACVLATAACLAACDSGNTSRSVTIKTSLTLGVVDETTRLARILSANLPDNYGLTQIEPTGVITITKIDFGDPSPLPDESQLARVGTETGLWTPADAARMVRTRARDGMVRSDNGKTTWTNPKHGDLQIVARVP